MRAGIWMVALFSVLGAPAAASGAQQDALQEVLEYTQARALHADRVDWVRVTGAAVELQQRHGGELGTDLAIAYVLRELGDGHSFYRPPADRRPPLPARSDKMPAKPEIAQVDTDGGRYPRLSINGWAGRGGEIAEATRRVRQAAVQAMATPRCGLVLDVSHNRGGNMWPMMGGIAPLYDEGMLEQFRARHGRGTQVRVVDGVLHSNAGPFPDVTGLPPLPHRPRYIALMLGKATASSGEILALGFRHQANVRSFGTPTAGKTSANSTLNLSNGGMAAITTAVLVDRKGQVQHGPLLPDVETDSPLAEAERWLDARCQRSAGME